MHTYRTHKCGELRAGDVGKTVRLSGWISRKRDHGNLLFIDLRDHYGITQIVINSESPVFAEIEKLRVESVITVTGEVLARTDETKNDRLPTGAIELKVSELAVQSSADVLPFAVGVPDDAGEDIRLRYRYLDLRREKMQRNIKLRSQVISYLRNSMLDQGFNEFQTPIITASSPEGARDYLVPSRLYPGKFYALPQAPQQFKQLLMVAGFDRYFQIAPCFRDEDGRADRTAEFYQLDVEMSYVTQEDVFATIEPVIGGLFKKFADFQGQTATVTDVWPRITYRDALLKYGSDKPDLRNPLEIVDVTSVFARDDVEFKAFKSVIEKGGVVRAIRAPKVSSRPRSFFDKLNDWAREEGAPGLGYVIVNQIDTTSKQSDGVEVSKEYLDLLGPIAKFIGEDARLELVQKTNAEYGDAIFFVCDKESAAAKMAGKARNKICDDIGGIKEENAYRLLWVVDFPLYEEDEKTGKIDFNHNPFTMPQGGMEALQNTSTLDILANQYDAVCNGYELASGGIRNHRPDIMEKVFELVGYTKDDLEKKFSGMLNAFRFGPPPHGGCAFGIDRMIMLIAGEQNLREVNAFVMNGAYEDQMMGAPTQVDEKLLRDLGLQLYKAPSVVKKTA
jgi:aspartyl-tRNA synthetase